jgi:hypothetical protein
MLCNQTPAGIYRRRVDLEGSREEKGTKEVTFGSRTTR